MDIRYPATIEPQKDGSFFVQFVDLPDTFTEGRTEEEALFNAAEVLSAMLAWRLDDAKDVPAPSAKVKGAHYVAPDAKTQAAMLLRLARGERSLSELARARPWRGRSKRRGRPRSVWKTRRIGHRSRHWSAPRLRWASVWC
jgi:antitoxin HicB